MLPLEWSLEVMKVGIWNEPPFGQKGQTGLAGVEGSDRKD